MPYQKDFRANKCERGFAFLKTLHPMAIKREGVFKISRLKCNLHGYGFLSPS